MNIGNDTVAGLSSRTLRFFRAAGLAVLFAAALASTTCADPLPNARKFAHGCRQDMASCRDVLTGFLADQNAACTPSLEQVLAEIDRHPAWGGEIWTRGVTSAVDAICARGH